MFVGPRFFFARSYHHPGSFSVNPAGIRGLNSNILLYCSIIFSFELHAFPLTRFRNDVGSSISTFFINFFFMRSKLCIFPNILMSPTLTDKNIFVSYEEISIPKLVVFPDQVPSMLLRTVSPTRVLLVGIHKENKRRTAGSSMCSQDFGHLCFGRRIHTSGHCDVRTC